MGVGNGVDVGVDINRDGEEGLKEVGDMVQRVREREKKDGRDERRRGRFVLSKYFSILYTFDRGIFFEILFASMFLHRSCG